jgi:hypothetical protein
MKMYFRFTLEMSEAEVRALKAVLDHPFHDNALLGRIVGPHSGNILAAMRARDKVETAIQIADKSSYKDESQRRRRRANRPT